MPRSLPASPQLTHLKRQARDLLRAYHAGDGQARQRFAPLPNGADSPQTMKLAHALFVIAREYGFASWPALKRYIATLETATPPAATKSRRQQRIAAMADRLVEAARRRDAWELFKALQIGRYDGDAVRELLLAEGSYSLIVDLLLESAASPNARLRFLAAQAMDHFADERCSAPLQRLLSDPVPRVRWAAIHSLQCDTCKLTPLAADGDITAILIERALHDPSIRVRRVATAELGRHCTDPRVVTTLEAIQHNDSDETLLRVAAAALKRHSD